MLVRSPSAHEVAVYFRSLGALFEAGVSLPRGLHLLAEQSPHPQLREASQAVERAISQGHSLSNAFSKRPSVFNTLQRRLLAAGESSGRLSLVLNRIAHQAEEQAALQRKLSASLMTPLWICSICCIMALVLPPLCLSGMLEMLSSSGLPLPLPTRVLLQFHRALTSPIIWLLAGMIGIGLTWGWRRFADQYSWKMRLWRIGLHIPGLNAVLRTSGLLGFGQTLVSLLECGTPLLQSLKLSAQTSGDPVLEERIEASLKSLQEGGSISESLDAMKYLPMGFVRCVEAGQESGSLAPLLKSILAIYSLELDERLDAFSRTLEPVCLGIIGLMVAGVALAALLPLNQLIQNL